MKIIIFLMSLGLSISCSKQQKTGTLNFGEKKRNQKAPQEGGEEEINELRDRMKFTLEKERAWNELIAMAQKGFKRALPILRTKCFDCHNSDRKLPFYGKFIPLVKNHQRDGLKALDFAREFPFGPSGGPPDMGVLSAISTTILDRSMPLPSYTWVYSDTKITDKDELILLNWINPLIEGAADFKEKYPPDDNSPRSRARGILAFSCFRCHANGKSKGGFGNMQDMDKLVSDKKYVNLEDPENSLIYTLSKSGEMPPKSTKNRLAPEELATLLIWLREEKSQRDELKELAELKKDKSSVK